MLRAMSYAQGKSPQTIAALAKAREDPINAQRRAYGLAMRKKINEAIDAHCGDHAVEMVPLMVSIANGTRQVKARAPAPHEDAASYALVPMVFPSIREQLAAQQWLIEYRNGRNLTGADVAQAAAGAAAGALVGQAIATDLTKLTGGELAIMEALLAKAEAKTVDGEIVSPEPAGDAQ